MSSLATVNLIRTILKKNTRLNWSQSIKMTPYASFFSVLNGGWKVRYLYICLWKQGTAGDMCVFNRKCPPGLLIPAGPGCKLLSRQADNPDDRWQQRGGRARSALLTLSATSCHCRAQQPRRWAELNPTTVYEDGRRRPKHIAHPWGVSRGQRGATISFTALQTSGCRRLRVSRTVKKTERVGEFGCWGASSKSGPVSSGQKRSALCWAAAKPDKQAHHSAARLVLTLLVSKQSVRRQEHPSQIPCTAGSDRETPTQVTPPTMQQHESRGCHILWEVWNTSLKMGKTKIFYLQWFIGFLNYIVSKPDNFSLC